MICSIDSLTEEVMAEYSSRKKQGRLSLVVDVKKREIYPVPKDIEHVDFVAQLETDPCHIIPVHLDFKDGKIVGVLTGESGIELKLGVKHSHDDLYTANSIAYDLINKSEIEAVLRHRNKIFFEYAE